LTACPMDEIYGCLGHHKCDDVRTVPNRGFTELAAVVRARALAGARRKGGSGAS